MGNCCLKRKRTDGVEVGRIMKQQELREGAAFCLSPLPQAALAPESPEKGGNLHFTDELPPTYNLNFEQVVTPSKKSRLQQPRPPPPPPPSQLMLEPKGVKIVVENWGLNPTFHLNTLCECTKCQTSGKKTPAAVFLTVHGRLVFHPHCIQEHFPKQCKTCASPFELIPFRKKNDYFYVCNMCLAKDLKIIS